MQNDHELIREYQNGSRSAYDKIVRRHLSSTVGFFYNITGDRMVSEDLAQDVFFKLYKHLKKFRFKSAFSTYLYRVNINTANSWLTRDKWKNFLHLDQAVEKGEKDHQLEGEWTRKELWNAIAKLPKKQKQVVMMRIVKELPYNEISNITGMSEGAAKVNYHHAVKRLKEQLRDD
mgnify:CR=1 FL=1|jgi:RNA polymerase sigma-70 factor (ECF subfamily)|tara:strand:- start:1805 stop:2329 length:525 start_codon:yes stop_codon:yes gene_type:complete